MPAMLKGGVIMDVINAEQARIAEVKRDPHTLVVGTPKWRPFMDEKKENNLKYTSLAH